MLEFFIFFICLIISFSFYSLNEYELYLKSYKKLKYMNFVRFNSILISNENTNEEFVIISEWNFCVSPKNYLQFDIWALVDLHRLYWIIKFHNRIKSLGLLKLL
jgi:hypothetical protein